MRILLVLCGLTLAGCNVLAPVVPGSGAIKQETRPVGDFTKVSFAGAADIVIVSGAAQASCAIQCDDNLLQFVSTEVANNELKIRLSPDCRISPTKRLQIEISMPSMSALELAGGSTTKITGLNSGSFDASLAGSHDLVCEGSAENVHFEAAGACKILAAKLETKSTSIELAGSGSVEVQASEKLSVEIAGSGTVRYTGEPAITQSIAGSGKIEKLN